MARIELNDTILSAIMKMAEGNPGAAQAMGVILKEHDAIDPQSAFGAFGAILSLDTHEIYGTQIYILFHDKCNRDVRRMLMLMRSVQLGLFPESRLKQLAQDQSRSVNLTDEEWNDLDAKVCAQLDQFQRPAVAA